MVAGDGEQIESTCVMAGDGEHKLTCKVAGNDKCLTCIMAGNDHVEKKYVNFMGVSTDLKKGVAKMDAFEQGRLSDEVKSALHLSESLDRFADLKYCAAGSEGVLL